MPLVIGITGSIATGKSSACEIMTGLGAIHSDADRVVHRMYDPGKPAFDRIVGIFGQEIVGEDGYIDRRLLGSKVFGEPEEMQKLTTAIGDIAEAVREVIDDWRQTLGQEDVALMEAVNLIEAGYGRWCDQVWLFASDDDTVRKRLESRNRYTPEEIDQRIASQRSWEDRAPASDLIIFNQDSYEELESQVRTEFARARELWNSGQLPASKYPTWWEENEQKVR